MRATFVAALAAIVVAAPAVAGEKCCKSTVNKMVARVMETMPQMTYKVGEFETHCSDAAKAKAGEKGAVHFVVDGKTYDSRAAADNALAERLEQEAQGMAKVVFAVGDKTYCCPMTAGQMAKQHKAEMTYRVAGVDFPSKNKADKAAKLVAAVMQSGAADETAALAGGKAKPGCSKPCGKGKAVATAHAATTTTKPGCSKPCDKAKASATAQTASAKSDNKPCCAKGKAVATAHAATTTTKPGCSKPCDKAKGSATAQTAAAKGDKPCCAKGKATAAATATAAGTQLASGQSAAGCCKKAEQRLASVQAKIRLMVETAATAL